MEIGFDAKRFFLNYTGLGNYSRFVVDALSRFHPSDHYTLFTPKPVSNTEVNPLLARSNIQTVTPDGYQRYIKSIWRSWLLSKHPGARRLDIYHGLSQELPFGLPRKVRTVVTVHDLIYLRFPEYYNPLDVILYKQKVKAACSLADTVVAVSRQTATDLVDFLGVDEKKIEVVYQGCHPSFREKVSAENLRLAQEKYRLPGEFILNVGTIERRKNVRLLVEALAMLPEQSRIPLVIVGRRTKYASEVMEVAKKYRIEDSIFLIHNCSFNDLPAIYQLATIFVYPSLFEGFGIPLVEAIESGVPVVSSTGSCFSEAAGPDSVYVDPRSSEELKVVLQNLLTDDSRRKEMVRNSTAWVKKFMPEVIAADINAIYRKLNR